MPSIQTAFPPELANNAIRQLNTELVVDMARQQFKKHMHETDPKKIHKVKDDVYGPSLKLLAKLRKEQSEQRRKRSSSMLKGLRFLPWPVRAGK